MGAIARTRQVDGQTKRGFEVVIGGGLGAVPQAAQVFDEFVPEEELLPLSQALSRVFSRLGERQNRARARFKFVVKKLGIEETRRLVVEERAKLRPDPRWTAFLADLHSTDEKPLRPAGKLPEGPLPDGFPRWRESNVVPQRQPGFVMALVTLPLGDLTSEQGRALADVARRYTGDTMRTTADQNMLLRWVSEADLPEVYSALVRIRLATPGAGTIGDITACPGTDTCKLGISSSRSLAAELTKELAASGLDRNPNARHLHIKASGCFNSCGQHHVADLGFLGVSRNVGGRRVPHFQLVVGGQWTNNGGSYGLAIGAVPSKRVPEMVKRLAGRYAAERKEGETFAEFTTRIGKKTIRAMVEELQKLPTYDQDPSFYSDWGDPREYTITDMGEGECAGEVVPYVEVELAGAERELFESQMLLDDGKIPEAYERAFAAMLRGARALVREKNANIGTEADEIVAEFRKHFFDTQVFFDPFAGGKFANYFFRAYEERGIKANAEAVHQQIEEATLFVDAVHQCYTRLGSALRGTALTAGPTA
jgi:sulfite reductase (ferredoxin)